MNEPSHPIQYTAPEGVILRKAVHPPVNAASASNAAGVAASYVLIAEGANLYLKRSSEDMAFALDFGFRLDGGEHIEFATWSIDDAPLMIKGAPTIKGTRVIQVITGGEVKRRFAPRCTATTSTGRKITLPESSNAYIEITR